MTKAPSIPKPGYTTTTPLYPAIRDLSATLGAQDTKVNLGEVSLRLFERMANAGTDPTDFIDAMCRQMGVNTSLRGIAWQEIRLNGHQFSIAQTMAIADAVLRRLGREYRAYWQLDPTKWKSQNGREQFDALTALVENLPAKERKVARTCPEFDLIQYYRAIRNRVIHRSGRNTDEILEDILKNHEAHFRSAYKIIPNRYAAIAYSDFELLTRSIKYYSRILNQVCRLTPIMILQFHLSKPALDGSSVEITGPSARKLPWLTGFRRLKGRPMRTAGVVNAFQTQYAMSDADAHRFNEALQEFFQRDGSKKARNAARKLGKK